VIAEGVPTCGILRDVARTYRSQTLLRGVGPRAPPMG
jgi:hypothetical protein